MTTYQDLGQRTVLATYCGTVLGDVELLAGDAIAAERVLTELCQELAKTHDWSHLASSAGDLAEALYVHGRLEEAEHWTRVAEKHAASDDLDAQIKWRPVRAKILARRGALDEAEALARNAARLSEESDGLNWQAKASRDLGEVLQMIGRHNEAVSAFERAIELYELKGNLVGAVRVRTLQERLALV
jgi:tetratricopeptide (TPR) repeat protein